MAIFSCRDEKVLELDQKEADKTYIAMWHGALYGARMDNGHENSNQASWKKSIFKDFDITMMGDFSRVTKISLMAEWLIVEVANPTGLWRINRQRISDLGY